MKRTLEEWKEWYMNEYPYLSIFIRDILGDWEESETNKILCPFVEGVINEKYEKNKTL